MEPLTRRQEQVLRMIAEHIRKHGFAPTIREVASAMKIAIKGAQDHLTAIERKGYIERRVKAPRALRITQGSASGEIPILGRIAAGRPVDASENFEGTLSVAPGAFGRGELFALKVRGESMIGDHILDGDHVVIRKQGSVENGQIAAVALEDEVTLKHVYIRGARAELRPSNPEFKPLAVPAESVRIIGKMVGLVRA